jgi:FMN phosphatase YigB (HAD superfamily)
MFEIPQDVRVISFDIWKTLLNAKSGFTWPRLEIIFRYLGLLDLGQDAIMASYKKAEKALNLLAEQTGYDTGMAERIEFMLKDLDISGVAVPDDEAIGILQRESGRIRMLPAFRPTLTEPDLLETLRGLKDAGYRLGTLSNTGMGDCRMVKPILERLGLAELMNVMLFSCEDGRAKPNKGLFHHMAEQFGVKPHEVMHIGDNVDADYVGAILAGLNAVLYAPKGRDDTRHIRSMKDLAPSLVRASV